MTLPLGGITMGDRCLSALKALGGEATSDQVRARVESDWHRPLTTAQVAVALARLSREYPPRVAKVTLRRRAPEGGHVWRAVFTPADVEVLAGEVSAFEDRVTAAIAQAGEARA